MKQILKKPIFWFCLKERCRKNCCGPKFNNGTKTNIFGMSHDQLPLTLEDKNKIVAHCGLGHIQKEADGGYYIKFRKDNSCPFWKEGLCSIEDIKPSICRAYPFIEIDPYFGVTQDMTCPGFEAALQYRRELSDETLFEMLKSLYELYMYRTKRLQAIFPLEREDEQLITINEKPGRF